MSDLDFKASSNDGFEQDWPLTQNELAPYYERAEQCLGVVGTRDGIPQLPDGHYFGSEPLDGLSTRLRDSIRPLGTLLIPARLSVRTNTEGLPCIHCGRSGAGCIEHNSSVSSTLAAAMKTGRLTLFIETIVRDLIADASGNAIGLHAIDCQTHRDFEIFGRMFFLCASALESTRILLNSVSDAHPAGFGNSSGTLGRYLMDHVTGVSLTAHMQHTPGNEESTSHPVRLLYIPRHQNLYANEHRAFLRGYGWQVSLLRADRYSPDTGPGCGPKVAKQINFNNGLRSKAVFRLQAFGEMLPRFDNYVEIDQSGARDAWGVPVLAIHCAHGENEREMVRDMGSSAHAFASAVDASIVSFQSTASEPGLASHEAGTCRMGLDPRTSVLNRFNQCHDAPNVFVTDASSFPSQGTQNPTLTIMALTLRACRYALARARTYELKGRRSVLASGVA